MKLISAVCRDGNAPLERGETLASLRHETKQLVFARLPRCGVGCGGGTRKSFVDGRVIADPKVASGFNETHIAQMLGYLNITGLDVALLLNFREATLTWKRVVRGNQEEDHGLRG
ncbi:MAG: GxxExxY protein [Verrucomicrobiales bacterium]|nr:GxxExxY protein [Verrucomicrobiales bacterium]